MINEYVEEKEEIEKAKNSYINKEKFIALLQSLDFIAVKDVRIDFITGFTVNGKDDVSTLGYDIHID